MSINRLNIYSIEFMNLFVLLNGKTNSHVKRDRILNRPIVFNGFVSVK